MGNEVSGEGDYYDNDNDDEDDYAKQFDGIETLGYRVLGVQPDSPGEFFLSLVGLIVNCEARDEKQCPMKTTVV